MTVTKLKQKSYDKLRNNYVKKLKKDGDSSSDMDIESDDSSSSGNDQNLIKFFESKYNRRSLISLLSEGPQVLNNDIVTNLVDLEEEIPQDECIIEDDEFPSPEMEICSENNSMGDNSSAPDSEDVLFCSHHVGKVLLSGNYYSYIYILNSRTVKSHKNYLTGRNCKSTHSPPKILPRISGS